MLRPRHGSRWRGRPRWLPPDDLTAREVEVLGLIAIGRSNADIATALSISLNTVATHVRSILAKTRCANRTEAAYAMRKGIGAVMRFVAPRKRRASGGPGRQAPCSALGCPLSRLSGNWPERRREGCSEVVRASRHALEALLNMRYSFDGIRKIPHPEEAAKRRLEGHATRIQAIVDLLTASFAGMTDMKMKRPCVYILASRRNRTLYVGVTSDLAQRIGRHRSDAAEGFVRRYGVYRPVFVEFHETMADGIVREKRIKRWRRAWKLKLIEQQNPQWRDLCEDLTL
jgi:putative endonuclease